jgi:hypothetical protein
MPYKLRPTKKPQPLSSANHAENVRAVREVGRFVLFISLVVTGFWSLGWIFGGVYLLAFVAYGAWTYTAGQEAGRYGRPSSSYSRRK